MRSGFARAGSGTGVGVGVAEGETEGEEGVLEEEEEEEEERDGRGAYVARGRRRSLTQAASTGGMRTKCLRPTTCTYTFS